MRGRKPLTIGEQEPIPKNGGSTTSAESEKKSKRKRVAGPVGNSRRRNRAGMRVCDRKIVVQFWPQAWFKVCKRVGAVKISAGTNKFRGRVRLREGEPNKWSDKGTHKSGKEHQKKTVKQKPNTVQKESANEKASKKRRSGIAPH